MTELIPHDPAVTPRARVLSGMRPTGRLHLGNYMGALYNWVQLQHEYECYFFIADYHALTTDYADTTSIQENIYEVALDFLAAGLDPTRCTIFVQSQVPQHAELHLLLSMLTPLSLLERVPSYKDQQEQLREKDLATYGFLGYPLLQSADILLYQPHFVPVGQDQAAHVELTREVARRFNQLYSPKRLVSTDGSSLAEEPDPAMLILPEPNVLLTPTPKLPGVDGRKMSKSYGNSILLSDHPSAVLEKMSRMTNGGQRSPQSEPGDPDRCPVGDMHALFSTPMTNDMIRERCRTAEILCSQCRELAAGSINLHLHPIRERRELLEQNPDEVWSILAQGATKAKTRADQTMKPVRSAMGLTRNEEDLSAAQAGRPYSSNDSSRIGHDLSSKRTWWDLEPNLRAKNVRDYWLRKIVPNEVSLTQDSDQVYVTSKKKRVYVTTSRENQADRWGFEAKPKSYELLALLCWSKTYWLHDFVVPQSLYQAPWTSYKKANKDGVMVFWVRLSESRFFLELPGAEPIDITDYRGQYKPMT